MKKVFSIAAAMLLTAGALMAQNSFKGIVKYKVESTGQVSMQIPDEIATAEIKVMGDQMYTKAPIFTQGLDVFVNGLKQIQCIDYSQLISYLAAQGFEFENYKGDGKILVEHTFNASTFDSLEIKDTEPGHFYFEYVDGETKEIAGQKCYKLVQHYYNDEGVENQIVMWYSKEIGPAYNIIFEGIKGMPLECTMDAGEGRAITYTAIEVIKGKVKDADFLLPDGFKKLTDEEREAFSTDLQDARDMGYLPGGGDDDD
jgi:hypothetical protein